jgi:membrane protease YdiL (CAAX protease family)
VLHQSPLRTMTAFLRRHPSASYFALAFALSWGGVLAVVAPGPIPAPPQQAQRLFTFVYLAMLIGPAVAGIALTAVVAGPRGVRDFRERLLRWRVATRWYAVALFTAPLLLLGTLVILLPLSREFVPAILTQGAAVSGPVRATSATSFLLLGLGVGIGAGFFEELGWTGFAVPSVRSKRGIVSTGLFVGVMWGAWHFLAILWGSAGAFGSVPIPVYLLVALFSFLPPYRVLMVWVYDRTQSLLIAVLMHASLTASMVILGPPVSGSALLTHDLTFAGALWVVVAGVAVLRIRAAHEPSRSAMVVDPSA